MKIYKTVTEELIAENKKELVHISDLCHGDTVIVYGESYTVGRKKIKNGFTGWTYRGDPHFQTKGMLERVLFKKFAGGKVIRWVSQP